MTFIFNAASNTVGGGVQTATNFILLTLELEKSCASWQYFISPQIAYNLQSLGVDPENDRRFMVVPVSPARSYAARKKLSRKIDMLSPKLVYTMSGPAYIRISAPHVMGCSNAYISHAKLGQYFELGVKKGFIKLLESFFKFSHIHRCDHLIFQTTTARYGFLKRSFWPLKRTSVVPNALGHSFVKTFSTPLMRSRRCPSLERPLLILVPSAGYKHKNLDIVLPIAKILDGRYPGLFRFVMTLPEGRDWNNIQIDARKAGLESVIVNIGPFNVAEAPGIYIDSDLMFLPTQLETFSASYLEAMWCGLPIVTSDLPFAHEICGPAAVYVDTKSAQACSMVLTKFLTDEDMFDNLVNAGNEQVLSFPNLKQRYTNIVNFLIEFSKQRDAGNKL